MVFITKFGCASSIHCILSPVSRLETDYRSEDSSPISFGGSIANCAAEKMLFISMALLATSLETGVSLHQGHLQTAYEWKYLDYLWDSGAQREEAVQSGAYDFSRVSPADVDKAPDGRVFVTLAAGTGVPATLAVVSNETAAESGPLLMPYPNWSWHRSDNCQNGITGAYGITIDECNRLWTIDTGTNANCPAQLLAFDLDTDDLIRRIEIPNNIARNSLGQSLLANIVAETEGPNCEETIIYVSDALGYGLIVWNSADGFVRLQSPSFAPPAQSSSLIGAASPIAGILDMDLSPSIFPNETRFLYFRAPSSLDLYAVDTSKLKSVDGDVEVLGIKGVLSSPAAGQAFSSEGTLFLGMTREFGIACWNRYRELSRDNVEIVDRDEERLEYANAVKVVPPSISQATEELWVLTNRFLRFELGQLRIADVNFRVLKGSVGRLIAGTKCELPYGTRLALEEMYLEK